MSVSFRSKAILFSAMSPNLVQFVISIFLIDTCFFFVVHPGAIYAGVYYVSAPREIVASGLSHGCLRFLDPRQGADMAQVRLSNRWHTSFICICVFFPLASL